MRTKVKYKQAAYFLDLFYHFLYSIQQEIKMHITQDNTSHYALSEAKVSQNSLYIEYIDITPVQGGPATAC